MQLLVELSSDRHTILMVTHDSKVADYAGRVLHMHDGAILQ
jgi:macrolide transport system ATP-binding/permease protein